MYSSVVKIMIIALFDSVVCYHDAVCICVYDTEDLLYITIKKKSCDELWFIMWLYLLSDCQWIIKVQNRLYYFSRLILTLYQLMQHVFSLKSSIRKT